MSAYQLHLGKMCVRACTIIHSATNPDGMISLALWKKWCRNRKDAQLQVGGNGRTALYELAAVPEPYYTQIIQRWGDPLAQENALSPHFRIDAQARAFYDGYRFADGGHLRPDQIVRYTVNASVLNALGRLLQARTASRKSRGGSTRGIWKDLLVDMVAFQEVLPKLTEGHKYSLSLNQDHLSKRLREYQRLGYAVLIDGRNRNENAREVTPQMIQLWRDLYAGQRGLKPTHIDIYRLYQQFLAGQLDIMCVETAELYDRTAEHFVPAAESTIYEYQNLWEHKVGHRSLRSGDRAGLMQDIIPYHDLKQPEYAGSIISVDDRQPPFEYMRWDSKAKKYVKDRVWFYNAVDIGSEAITCWVHGESKKGIIIEFYQQLVRNYVRYDQEARAQGLGPIHLPYEVEAESSLNSSFVSTFLSNGAMFQSVRIEANNPRGKWIEPGLNKSLRYKHEKTEEDWVARPFARSEANQKGKTETRILKYDEIVRIALKHIADWNNSLHRNQELHPGKTRWDVFMEKQHPKLQPTNWKGILPHLGKMTKTSMHAGRVQLQEQSWLAGIHGKAALGNDLTQIMKMAEGKEVTAYWLDDENGNVIKAIICDLQDNTMICELVSTRYHRSTLERMDEDGGEDNRAIMSAYAATVIAYMNRSAEQVGQVMVIEREQPRRQGRFVMPGLEPEWQPDGQEAIIAPAVAAEDDYDQPDEDTDFKIDTASRY